jgi:hypothetical protein
MANEKVAVKMQDGRTVEFGIVQKVRKEILLNPEGRAYAIRFDARNGDTEVVNVADVPADIATYLVPFGLSHKLGDEYADEGTPADCMEAMRQLWQRIKGGNWKGERTGIAQSGILFEACKLAYPTMTPEAIREVLNGMSAKEKAAFKVSDEMRGFVQTVEKERSKGVDTSKLVAKFQKA